MFIGSFTTSSQSEVNLRKILFLSFLLLYFLLGCTTKSSSQPTTTPSVIASFGTSTVVIQILGTHGDNLTPPVVPDLIGNPSGNPHAQTNNQRPITPHNPSPTPTPSVIASPARPTFYEVKTGDTLAEIAGLFQIPTDYLAQINHITDINYIYVGQILEIPAQYIPLTPTPIAPVYGKLIVVILSEQKTYVYEDGVLLKTFIISSGVPAHPTVLGNYLIDRKLESTRMIGEDYDLPDVPWVMYFYQGYSFHGTYWHDNFGTPMSHGCLNMRTEDAKWLYDWAPIGTLVRILP